MDRHTSTAPIGAGVQPGTRTQYCVPHTIETNGAFAMVDSRAHAHLRTTAHDLPDAIAGMIASTGLAGRVTIAAIRIACDTCAVTAEFNIATAAIPDGWTETVDGHHYCGACQ